MAALSPGSFEYLEAKIRRDAEGTLFGRDFEWACQWYLEHAPLYRGKFRRVWRWADWPDRWGPDCGIDLIAETHEGKLWAIQAKAVGPGYSITKAEINSFLSESNRPQIAFRLLIGTTDNIGANARRTIEEQAKHAAVVLRGDLVSADIVWPTRVGAAAPKPKRAKPRPHQRQAISAVVRGFRKHGRGRLIMACGTGKTLTGLWIHERLKSRRTLLLVPSISLVQQNLREWGRHAREDFDFLVVCSDESVASDRDDPALRYIAELGIDVTTEAKDIAAFLAKRRRLPAVVIATYQSSDRVSAGQRKARKTFDLALCDEAHRLVGDMRGKFSTVLDERKIRCRRRLFMTATPRYFTQRARQRAADEDLEVASMDDPATFGPEFHVLKFYDAITAKPTPLLTDYRVVVIGVTNAEAARWVEEGQMVRTREGAETDARTLAAQIGLAKAMREYDLRRVITFHRSIRRASRFVDAELLDSLPRIIETLRPGARPAGKLWARHISGETPASKRASMLRSLAELPSDTRGLISNCACLGEGVDVPALDGIAFIDPKGSIVDIIQAVGRVIRLSPDKTVGTIVIPVFIDQSSDTEHVLEQSAFDPVWQVLKALRAHDRRLADELDELRTSHGKQVGNGKRIKLPANIVLDVPRLLLADFEQAFYVRAIERVTERPPLTIEQILAWADEHKERTGAWPKAQSGLIPGTNGDKWANIEVALQSGGRGWQGKSSIARLLHEHRGLRNRGALPPLTLDSVLQLVDKHKATFGEWPNSSTRELTEDGDTWSSINAALMVGLRGLFGGSSLAQLLRDYRGVRNPGILASLSLETILDWADDHHSRTGEWPTSASGPIEGTDEVWRNINACLFHGRRGLKGGSSIAQLLALHRKVLNAKALPKFTIKQILRWADSYFTANNAWPTRDSGTIPGIQDTWQRVDSALLEGIRGLRGGSSLRKVLQRYRRVRNKKNLPRLTLSEILSAADRYHRKRGEWPTRLSQNKAGAPDSWKAIDGALAGGLRGLPKGWTLARLLFVKRGVNSARYAKDLRVKDIVTWAKRYRQRHGRWPGQRSGRIEGTQDTWCMIDHALAKGRRGLRGGLSLAQLLAKHGL